MGQVIAVTSGKGGVGKTASVAGLGAALSLLQQKTVLVDLDVGLPKLDLATGIADRSSNHWGDVIEGQCTLSQAFIPHPHYSSLSILPAPSGKPYDCYTKEDLNRLYQQLAEQFDFILIDCPTGAGQGFEYALRGADTALIVVQCELTSVRDSDKIAQLVTELGILEAKLIINRYQPDLVQDGVLLSIEQVMELIKLPLAGIVYEDLSFLKAMNAGEPIFLTPDSKRAICYQNIAKRLLGQEIPMATFKKGSFLSRLKK